MDFRTKCDTKISEIFKSNSPARHWFLRHFDKIFAAILIMVSLAVTILAYILIAGQAIATDDIVPKCVNGNEINDILDPTENESIEFLRYSLPPNDKNRNVKLIEHFLDSYSDNEYQYHLSGNGDIKYLREINTNDKPRTINRTITPIVS